MSNYNYLFNPNRTICDVMDEMRKCCKTGNYSYLPGLIEECQSLANRMEAALFDQKDLTSARKIVTEIKAEIRKLEKEKEDLCEK